MKKPMQEFLTAFMQHFDLDHYLVLEGCLNCRQCGHACAWYLATGREDLHPTYKTKFIRQVYERYFTVQGRIAGRLGLIPTPTLQDVREHQASYWRCTACGRCTLACPLGLSNRRITRLARAAYAGSGLVRETPSLRTLCENTERTSHSYGLLPEQILLRAALFLLHRGVDVPLGVEHAEYLFVCAAAGLALMPEYTPNFFVLLNAAGVDYSLSPRVFDPGTDIEHIVGDQAWSRKMILGLEAEAERLKVSKIIVSECACDVHTFYTAVHKILGRPFKFPVVFLDALLLDLIRSGRLPVRKIKASVTLHDPCYITRLSGFGDLERELLDRVIGPLVEMNPSREWNYCCNGGVGPWRMKENETLRREVSVLKANQIRQTGAERVVTPCAICFVTLRDIGRHYHLAAKVHPMFEVVCQAATAALQAQNQWQRAQQPARWRESKKEPNTFRIALRGLMASPDYDRLKDWLSQDTWVKAYIVNHPEADRILEALQHRRIPEAGRSPWMPPVY